MLPMNRFPCPHCGKKLKSPERAAGQLISCPKCGQSLVVPPPVQTAEQSSPDTAHGQLVPVDTGHITPNLPTESRSEIVFQPPTPILIHFETPSQPSKTGPL